MRYPALVLVNRQGFLFRTTSDHSLFAIAIIGLTIKLAGFALDQTPLFFMGDSGTYILSAIHHFVPSDRSFTYGLLLRWLAVWPGNLEALILAQVLVSAATAWLLGFTLLYFFEVQPALAIMASVAFCLDPLQILHERLVLTEAFTIFVNASVRTSRSCRICNGSRQKATLAMIARAGCTSKKYSSVKPSSHASLHSPAP